MAKVYPSKPFLILLYGFPGSGKTYFARQFCEGVQAAHMQAERIRGELFEQPRYDQQENEVVAHIMNYMTEEFLTAGLSVVYDTNAIKKATRRRLYDMAMHHRATPLLVWFQMDAETAFERNVKRDRRRADDKFAMQLDRSSYEDFLGQMQNPGHGEDYVVVSGKHLFNMQQSAVVAKLRSLGSLADEDANSRVIKPGLVNLVPKGPGRFDASRRNIYIR
ncbi:MAG TPA: ATP-binding protein [Candidatus Saccharimonadia bacterium]|nr:ATP-binding protein [Candidatus Saccharimonadia bacterium]